MKEENYEEIFHPPYSKNNRNGFTLIELIIVIVIIAILAAIAIPAMNGYINDAKQATANANAKMVYDAATHSIAQMNALGNVGMSTKEVWYAVAQNLSGQQLKMDARDMAYTAKNYGGKGSIAHPDMTKTNKTFFFCRANTGAAVYATDTITATATAPATWDSTSHTGKDLKGFEVKQWDWALFDGNLLDESNAIASAVGIAQLVPTNAAASLNASTGLDTAVHSGWTTSPPGNGFSNYFIEFYVEGTNTTGVAFTTDANGLITNFGGTVNGGANRTNNRVVGIKRVIWVKDVVDYNQGSGKKLSTDFTFPNIGEYSPETTLVQTPGMTLTQIGRPWSVSAAAFKK